MRAIDYQNIPMDTLNYSNNHYLRHIRGVPEVPADIRAEAKRLLAERSAFAKPIPGEPKCPQCEHAAHSGVHGCQFPDGCWCDR